MILNKILNKMEKITISKEILQELLSNFYEVCSLCNELDIYEHEELDESLQQMKSWTQENFGRKIDKPEYE
jgi:hypothetical protein